MAKKIPMRQCVGCQGMHNKKEIVLDITGKKNGRGAYICRNRECFERARASKGLERSFKRAVSAEIYDNLLKEFEHLNE